MKKISILLLLFSVLCIIACSLKSEQQGNINPEAYAIFKDSTLTFYYGKGKPKGAYDVENFVENN